MTSAKSTTIEIFSLPTNDGQKTGQCAKHDINSCTNSLCIKITDPHGESTNIIQLASNGTFQKQLLEQTVSIVSQSGGESDQLKRQKSYLRFLVDNIPAFGIVCALISVLCFSFNSVIVKLLKTNYGIPGIQVLVTRAIFQFVICGLVTVFKRKSFWGVPGTRTNLWCRALTGTFSLSCIFTAFNMVPIGDATTIYFSSPVVVTIVAYFILKEPFRMLQLITCLLTIVGVGFISKPVFIFGVTTDIHYPYMLWGQGLAILAAISSSITLINLRMLKTTPPSVVVFWFAASIILFGSLALYVLDTFKPIDLTDMLCMGLLSAIGLMSVTEQYFLTIALQHEDATTISVTRSFNIVLAFLWEVVIFNETVIWTSIVGAILVSLCIVLLAFSKSWSKISKVVGETFRNEDTNITPINEDIDQEHR